MSPTVLYLIGRVYITLIAKYLHAIVHVLHRKQSLVVEDQYLGQNSRMLAIIC